VFHGSKAFPRARDEKDPQIFRIEEELTEKQAKDKPADTSGDQKPVHTPYGRRDGRDVESGAPVITSNARNQSLVYPLQGKG
jgi:hypothetical protein